ncbi:ABC transporter ATP-binding protein [Rhizobium azibense]|uniref:Sulfonate transport system ATP-binding protein n=1 Tax=Rhizobium azibense TaxID=1136135 RepID=A0A4R3RF09_9HYPH|nr:ABC transporter ATP-binding protein [Rhizobium azibense]TCU33561.1 sulfonate transport system ATP-binding protein [Rhizobium azibense]
MLSLKALTKTYANGVKALGGFTLDVAPGEIVAVIGGSGCGKSTLLRLIGGLDQPTSGTTSINGEIVDRPHPLINLVFQEPRLLPWLTVHDNVGFGLAHADRDERETRVRAALQQVHLKDYGHRLPKELSGGQAQRVAIARALVMRPEVLLLDEPFSALDALTRATLHRHLLDIWSETGATMILVTHDLEEAVALAHRVIVMQPWPGRILDEIIISGPPTAGPDAAGLIPDRRHPGRDKTRVRAALDRSLKFAEAGSAAEANTISLETLS